MPKLVNRFFAAKLLLISSLLTGVADALPVNYSEIVSGDLVRGTTSPVMYFDNGTNTVTGNTHFALDTPTGGHFDYDSDAIYFNIAAGSKLTSISFAFDTEWQSLRAGVVIARLCNAMSSVLFTCVGVEFGTQDIDILGSSPVSLDFALDFPLYAGTYLLTGDVGLSGLVGSGTNPGWWTDYVYSFEVKAIPEPESTWLFAFGLLAIVAVRKRSPTPTLRTG